MKKKDFGTIASKALAMFLSTVLLLNMTELPVFAADTLVAEVDSSSTYTPTQIVNGGFDTEPWVDFSISDAPSNKITSKNSGNKDKAVASIYYHGTDGGWNTTESKVYSGGTLFEWIQKTYNGNKPGHGSAPFIEQNANNPSVQFQDLTTKGGDVIRWSLWHAARSDPKTNQLHVEVGAPNGNPPLGTNSDCAIKADTRAVYTFEGITVGAGTLGFAGEGKLSALRIPNTDIDNWKQAQGVYIVPDGQTVTRFAFASDLVDNAADKVAWGNYLDDISFDTLIGNLMAQEQQDESVVVTGYWGETDSSKSLVCKIGDTPYSVNMSSVQKKNFKITIPKTMIDGVDTITVYHEDYPQASRVVKIYPKVKVLMYVGQTNSYGAGSKASLEASMHYLENYYNIDPIQGVDTSVQYTNSLADLENPDLVNSYQLIFIGFPDDGILASDKIDTYANNLMTYANNGGCLVFVGESNGEWKKGNDNLTTLASKMGISISYGDNVNVQNGNYPSNTNADLCKYDSAHIVTNLYTAAIPSLVIGTGENTVKNTQVVYALADKPVITDTKVGNGYITFLTDINMWVGVSWKTLETCNWPSGSDGQQLMKNILQRSVDNIKRTSSMYTITYGGMDGANYEKDSDGHFLTNPTKYDEQSDSITLNNPVKENWLFAGWSGTGITGLSKEVTIPKGSSGNREYTANWHQHDWKSKADGPDTYVYCASTQCPCEYHGSETDLSKAVKVSINCDDMVYTGNAYEGSCFSFTGTEELKAALNFQNYSVTGKIYKDPDLSVLTGTEDGASSEGGLPVNCGTYYMQLCIMTEDGTDVLAYAIDSFKITKTLRTAGTVSMDDYTYGQRTAVPVPGITPETFAESPKITFYYNETDDNTGGMEWKDINSSTIPVGTYYMYALLAETDSYEEYRTATDEFTISKGEAIVDKTPEISLTYGDAIKDAKLLGGTTNVPGKFMWSESEGGKIPEVTDSDSTEYDIIFIPDDKNYSSVTVKTKVKVSPREVTDDTVSAVFEENTLGAVSYKGKELTKNKDYEIRYIERKDDIVKIVLDFMGNYSGTVTKYVNVPVGEGNIKAYVEMDAESLVLSPELEAPDEEKAKDLLLNNITNPDVKRIMASPDAIVDYEGKLLISVKEIDSQTESNEEVLRINEDVKKLIEEEVKEAAMLDISLFLDYVISDEHGTVLEKERKQITDSGNLEETISITIPKEYRNTNPDIIRTFYIIRAHQRADGTINTDLLVTTTNDRIVFKTSKFSTYAVLYSDKVKPKGNTPDGGAGGDEPLAILPPGKLSPKTSDSEKALWWMIMLAGGIFIASSIFIKRK